MPEPSAEGQAITLTLPVVSEGGELAYPRSQPSQTTAEIANPPGKILLVDDSPLVLQEVSFFLAEEGWTVLCAHSASEALHLVQEISFDLVVSDLNMPDRNGLELFRSLYALDATLPVVILSDEQQAGQILESMHAGVFDFVPKCEVEKTLAMAVVRAVTHGRLLRENRRLSSQLHENNEQLEERVREQASILEIRLRQESALEREAALAPLRKEVEIARRIQTSILPNTPVVPGLEIATQMMTASEVGGDYYDIRPTSDGCWIGIGDVAGHGLEAGLVMLMIQSGLASLILHHPDAQPHQILPAINKMLFDNLRERMGRDDHATLTMLRFYSDGRLLYAGAHEDILICNRLGQVRAVPTHGTWVGIQWEISHELETRSVQLEPGDLVILYTDGIPEARKGKNGFGLPRLISEITKWHTEPVLHILNHISEAVKNHCEGEPQDDASLIAFRYVPLAT